MFWCLLFACRGVLNGPDSAAPGALPTGDTAAADLPTPERQTSCDPLVPDVCSLPWPSSYFQLPDEQSASGVRWNLADDTLPVHDSNDQQVGPGFLGHTDGASILTPFLAYLDDVSTEGTVDVNDIGAYSDPDVLTVIVDAETGERVPHFVELDQKGDPGEQVLFLRPVAPMEHGHRYVVGLRGLVTTSGAPVVPSDAFLALREGTADDEDAAWRQPWFDARVFPVLADAGFARDELQLAWDVTIGSVEGSLGSMVAMRDDALERVGADGPPYTISSVVDDDCSVDGATIARTVEGTFTIPRYVDADTPPARLVLGADGLPAVQGETQAPFIVRIPCSVADAAMEGTPSHLLVYGHGLLGSRYEARTGHLSRFANERGYVVFAMDWTGMSEADALVISGIMGNDITEFPAVPERSMQGLVNKLVGLRAVRGAMADDLALQFGGQTVVGDDVGYYGISQGGILGGAYLALSPDIDRGVFGVGGMPYSLLLDRSKDFDLFSQILHFQFRDPREVAVLIAGFQTAWDVGEGSGYAHAMTRDPLPGTTPKTVLMQVGIGDAQVTTLGAHVSARAYDAVTLSPAVRPIWGVEERSGPVERSVLVEWSYPEEDITVPDGNLPPGPGDTHECPRREPAAQEQIDVFLRTGIVEQTCDGPCVSVCLD